MSGSNSLKVRIVSCCVLCSSSHHHPLQVNLSGRSPYFGYKTLGSSPRFQAAVSTAPRADLTGLLRCVGPDCFEDYRTDRPHSEEAYTYLDSSSLKLASRCLLKLFKLGSMLGTCLTEGPEYAHCQPVFGLIRRIREPRARLTSASATEAQCRHIYVVVVEPYCIAL